MPRSLVWLPMIVGAMVSNSVAQTATEPPDEVAYRILFTIMKASPPPHWDVQTKVNWLASAELTLLEVHALQTIATKYWQRVEPLESELRTIHDQFKGRNDSPEAALATRPVRDKIRAEYQSALYSLSKEISPEGMGRLAEHVQGMKKRMSRPGQKALVGHSHPNKESRQ